MEAVKKQHHLFPAYAVGLSFGCLAILAFVHKKLAVGFLEIL